MNELIDAGLDYIIYSFDGGSKKTYEKIDLADLKKTHLIKFMKI